jgi:hypothetical protein
MDTRDVQKVIGEMPPPLRGVPTTLVVMSTSGFTIEAHELAERPRGSDDDPGRAQ